MADEIEKLLVEAQLRSKFKGAIEDFSNLVVFVDKYVDVEESRVESDTNFNENEIDALDMVANDMSKVEEDLNKVKKMLEGGLA